MTEQRQQQQQQRQLDAVVNASIRHAYFCFTPVPSVLFYSRTLPFSGLGTKHHLSHLSLFSDIRTPSKLSSAIPLGLGSITLLSALQDYYEVVLTDYWEQGTVYEYSPPEVEVFSL